MTDDGAKNGPCFLVTDGVDLKSFMKVEVAVLGSPSLIVPTVSVDAKQQ